MFFGLFLFYLAIMYSTVKASIPTVLVLIWTLEKLTKYFARFKLNNFLSGVAFTLLCHERCG